jgi:Glycosyl transferase family 11
VIVFRDLAYDGRLGNQLWRIASTLGIAADRHDDARFGPWSYRPYFSVPDRYFDWVDGEDAATIPQHIEPRHRPWLQDANLWLPIEEQVRRFFAPSELARAQLQERYAELLAVPDRIAVHVRRGNYLNEPTLFPTCSQEYYRAALEALPAGNVVLFTDDPAWCAEQLAWTRPVAIAGYQVTEALETHSEGNPDYVDLLLMASCDRHVIANSSFSWWGAFLSANRSPVFPLRWYGPGFPDLDPTLMFRPDWIGVDA